MARPSSDQASPFDSVIPDSSSVTAPDGATEYSAPWPRLPSVEQVPIRNRPSGSQAPSLKRTLGASLNGISGRSGAPSGPVNSERRRHGRPPARRPHAGRRHPPAPRRGVTCGRRPAPAGGRSRGMQSTQTSALSALVPQRPLERARRRRRRRSPMRSASQPHSRLGVEQVQMRRDRCGGRSAPPSAGANGPGCAARSARRRPRPRRRTRRSPAPRRSPRSPAWCPPRRPRPA